MQFKFLTAAVAFSGMAMAQRESLTPETVVKSIETVTQLSADTNDLFTTLSPFNLITIIPRAINNVRGIITAVAGDVTMITNADLKDPFPKNGQEKVCETFRDFVRVHQALLDTIIGQGGLLSRTPFGAPIAAVFRAVEMGVDQLAFGLIDLIPTCAKGAKEDKMKLDKSFEKLFMTFA